MLFPDRDNSERELQTLKTVHDRKGSLDSKVAEIAVLKRLFCSVPRAILNRRQNPSSMPSPAAVFNLANEPQAFPGSDSDCFNFELGKAKQITY